LNKYEQELLKPKVKSFFVSKYYFSGADANKSKVTDYMNASSLL